MNPPANKPPNYADIVQDILKSVNGPIAVKDLAALILQARPSQAKNPHEAALVKIREEQGRQLVYFDETHVLPLRLAYQGARYRIRLTRENFDQAALSTHDCFHHYVPPYFREEDISLVDSQGNPILSKVLKAPHAITLSTEKKVEYKNPVIVLKEWFHSQRIY